MDLIGAEWAVIPARDGPSISLDKVLRRSVDDNAWDEERDEVWRGMDRSSRYGRVLCRLFQFGGLSMAPLPLQ